MANLKTKNADGTAVYVKGSGAGSDGDPFIPDPVVELGATDNAVLDAILAKLSADPATQTTLAALLAKIIAAPATEAKQDTLNAKDFATQTTLAALLAKFATGTVIGDVNLGATDNAVLDAILAKIIAAPATEAKQDTLIAKDFATQTTLAAILAKIIAAPATEAKQGGGLPAALAAGGGLKVEGVAGGVVVPISVATIPSHAVTNAGTFATQVDGAALTALQLIDNFISGARGLVTEDNSAAIKTAVETIDNAIAGSEMQVDIVGSLPAGSAAIGKLAANSGVDIGDVDVLSIVPGTGATNLGKAEDAAHSSGDVGVMSLAVRKDSGAAIAGADGDYSPLQVDANGNLRITGTISTTPAGGISISVTPTITAGAYSAKDCVGGVMTFANAVSGSGKVGILNTVTITDNDDEKAALELWLFNADPSGAADNAAMDFTDANLLKCVGVVPISSADYYSLADNGAACVRGIGLQFQCAATSLYGQLKCTATPTYTATSDITVILGIEYLN